MPLDLYYRVEEHVWVRPEPDGTATLGFSDVAQTVAGAILHVTFRPLGRRYAVGAPVAALESAKWLGALRTPVAGQLVAVNERLLTDAGLVNRSPYRSGWLARLTPDDLARDLAALLTGQAAADAYAAYMERRNLDECVHCEGYELP